MVGIALVEATLQRLARTYVWWLAPDDAISRPLRLTAQIMDIGDYDDVQLLAQAVGDDFLRAVLQKAEIGQFSPQSWAYWHYRLGLAESEQVPPLQTRRLSDSHEGGDAP